MSGPKLRRTGSIRWLFPACMQMVICTSIAAGHSDGPAPVIGGEPGRGQRPAEPGAPGAPVLGTRVVPGVTTYVLPPRWSWLHWWEANRDQHLAASRQTGGRQKADEVVVARLRGEAFEACVRATKSRFPPVRAVAAIALGRMSDPEARTVLTGMASKPPSPGALTAAVVGMGLLGTAWEQRWLTTAQYANAAQREAGLAALGLLTEPAPETIQALRVAASGREAGPATVATWALRRHAGPENAEWLTRIVGNSDSPWVVSEAILALGPLGRRNASLLSDILLGTNRGRSIAVWRGLWVRHNELVAFSKKRFSTALAPAEKKAVGKYSKDYEKWVADFNRVADVQNRWLRRHAPDAPRWLRAQDRAPKGSPQPPVRIVPLVINTELIYIARLRASAAIALGDINDPSARQALIAALAQPDEGRFSDLWKGFAIMSLGKRGGERAANVLGGYLSPWIGRGRQRQPKAPLYINSPLRGYAALALGLCARPVVTDQGDETPPHAAEICGALAERIADRRETTEVRAAAALALGLTGQTENLKLLRQVSQSAGRDEIVGGYLILARGMLGDTNILEPARRLLDPKKDRQDTSGILARRAAVLGLGLLDTPEVIPILNDAWHLSYHVNREVPLALALCGAQNSTDRLVELLTKSDKPWAQAFAAQCLGELFTKVRPQRLAWFTNGSNYTMKNMRMVEFQRLANEFLFSYLIPSFGYEWR